MAKSKRLSRMSAHFRRVADRDREVRYLHDAIEQLRHFYSGFEAREGYSLQRQRITRMSAASIKRVKETVAEVRRSLSSPHVIVRPRSAKSRAALEKHTGVEHERARKAFIVHVRKPERAKITVKRGKKKSSRSRVEETEQMGEVKLHREYFMFRDYTESMPVTMDEVLTLAELILKDMPRGRYVMLSRDHGYIGAPMNRDLLLKAIETDWLKYDYVTGSGGLAGTLIGFARTATTFEGGKKEYKERYTRRELMAAARRKAQSKRRARLAKRYGR